MANNSNSSSTATPAAPDFVVRHGNDHGRMVGEYFNNEFYSDLALVVGEKAPGEKDIRQRFKGHKFILGVKSEYFRTLLTNGMSESSQNEITIDEPKVDLFEKLLQYVYSGEMQFNGTDETIDMLVMANKYLFAELQKTIGARLEAILSKENFLSIYSAAFACSALDLKTECLRMADSKPSEILKAEGLSTLDMHAFNEIINRDSFKPIQSELFDAISKWIETNQGKDASQLLSNVRLEDMPTGFLLKTVRQSNFFTESRILDAAAVSCKKGAEIARPMPAPIDIVVNILRRGGPLVTIGLSNQYPFDTIARVKDQIRIKLIWNSNSSNFFRGISYSSIKLYYQETLLQDGRTLGSYSIPNGALLVAHF